MRKISTISLIIIALGVFCSLYAAQRSHDEMVSIAKQTLTQPVVKTPTLKAKGLQAAAATSVDEVVSSEAYSVFNSDNGFVLVSTDDRFPQVLGYGFEDKFDPNDMPPALVELLERYDRELRVLDSVSAIKPIVLKEAITFDDAVEPLIQTKWGQGTPFNNMAPMSSFCGSECRTVTGCVATAMAQVMYYYKHPAQGTGSKTYSCGNDIKYTCNEIEYISPLIENISADFNTTCLGRVVGTYTTPIPSINLPCGVYILRKFYSNGSVNVSRICGK